MHSPADVTAKLLADLGVGTDPTLGLAWPVYAADEPNNPDDCITVYDRAAANQGRVMYTGEPKGPEGIQVRVRSGNHTAGYAKAAQVFDALSLRGSVYRTEVTLGTVTYRVHCYADIDSPLPLGKDVTNTKRRLFVVNCNAILSEVES